MRRIPRPGGCRPKPGCGCSSTACSKSGAWPRTSAAASRAFASPRGKSLPQALEEATSALSGLSHCAGVVVAPKQDRPLKHLEFVHLGPGRALVVLVTEDGLVENRVIEVPLGLPPAALISAGNYLNARLIGRTIEEAPLRDRAGDRARTRPSSTS